MFSSTLLWCIVRAGAVNCVCIPLLLAFFFSSFSLFVAFSAIFNVALLRKSKRSSAHGVCGFEHFVVRMWSHTECVSVCFWHISAIFIYISSIPLILHVGYWIVCAMFVANLYAHLHLSSKHTRSSFFVSHLSNRDALEFVAAAALIVLYSHMFDATNTILFFLLLFENVCIKRIAHAPC